METPHVGEVLAGMPEERLVMHPDHKEAMLMNVLVEMEMRLQKLEYKG
jgi:hypothetical protein